MSFRTTGLGDLKLSNNTAVGGSEIQMYPQSVCIKLITKTKDQMVHLKLADTAIFHDLEIARAFC